MFSYFFKSTTRLCHIIKFFANDENLIYYLLRLYIPTEVLQCIFFTVCAMIKCFTRVVRRIAIGINYIFIYLSVVYAAETWFLSYAGVESHMIDTLFFRYLQFGRAHANILFHRLFLSVTHLSARVHLLNLAYSLVSSCFLFSLSLSLSLSLSFYLVLSVFRKHAFQFSCVGGISFPFACPFTKTLNFHSRGVSNARHVCSLKIFVELNIKLYIYIIYQKFPLSICLSLSLSLSLSFLPSSSSLFLLLKI